MDFFRCVSPGPANNDLVVLFVPLQNRAGADAQPLANLGRHGNLPLGGQLGFSDSHVHYITTVMRAPQIEQFASLIAQWAGFGLAAEVLSDLKSLNRCYQKATRLFGRRNPMCCLTFPRRRSSPS